MYIDVTKAEYPIIKLLIDGYSRAEIAAKLNRNLKTISCLILKVYDRNNIKNKTTLVLMSLMGSKLRISGIRYEKMRCVLYSYMLYKYGGCNVKEIADTINKSPLTVLKYLSPYFESANK
jgi:DNA-binding CsgD family transcriptional regulator